MISEKERKHVIGTRVKPAGWRGKGGSKKDYDEYGAQNGLGKNYVSSFRKQGNKGQDDPNENRSGRQNGNGDEDGNGGNDGGGGRNPVEPIALPQKNNLASPEGKDDGDLTMFQDSSAPIREAESLFSHSYEDELRRRLEISKSINSDFTRTGDAENRTLRLQEEMKRQKIWEDSEENTQRPAAKEQSKWRETRIYGQVIIAAKAQWEHPKAAIKEFSKHRQNDKEPYHEHFGWCWKERRHSPSVVSAHFPKLANLPTASWKRVGSEIQRFYRWQSPTDSSIAVTLWESEVFAMEPVMIVTRELPWGITTSKIPNYYDAVRSCLDSNACGCNQAACPRTWSHMLITGDTTSPRIIAYDNIIGGNKQHKLMVKEYIENGKQVLLAYVTMAW